MADLIVLYQACPKCKGGTVTIYGTVTGADGANSLTPITCDVCDGTSFVKWGKAVVEQV